MSRVRLLFLKTLFLWFKSSLNKQIQILEWLFSHLYLTYFTDIKELESCLRTLFLLFSSTLMGSLLEQIAGTTERQTKRDRETKRDKETETKREKETERWIFAFLFSQVNATKLLTYHTFLVTISLHKCSAHCLKDNNTFYYCSLFGGRKQNNTIIGLVYNKYVLS